MKRKGSDVFALCIFLLVPGKVVKLRLLALPTALETAPVTPDGGMPTTVSRRKHATKLADCQRIPSTETELPIKVSPGLVGSLKSVPAEISQKA